MSKSLQEKINRSLMLMLVSKSRKSIFYSFVKVFIATGFAIFLSACSSPTVNISSEAELNPASAYVYGVFQKRNSRVARHMGIYLTLQNLDTTEEYKIQFSGEKELALAALVPGKYTIANMIFTSSTGQEKYRMEDFDFDFFALQGEAVYLGDVIAAIDHSSKKTGEIFHQGESGGLISKRLSTYFYIDKVINNFDKTTTSLNQKFAWAANLHPSNSSTKWGGSNKTNPDIAWYEEKAKQGDKFAQYKLGEVYEFGQGLETDMEQAINWYKKAGEQGQSETFVRIGLAYLFGDGVEKSPTTAFEFFQKGADLNNRKAQNWLGVLYMDGNGVQRDYQKSFELLSKSAAQNWRRGVHNLGWLYFKGWGVEQDYMQAMELFEKAYELGNAKSAHDVGLMYDHGYGVKQDYEKAVEWYTKSVEGGYARAKYDLGLKYLNGEGVKQDSFTAMYLFVKASNAGIHEATHELALMFQEAKGFSKEPIKAVGLFLEAAEAGYAESQYHLAYMYKHGKDVDVDIEKAKMWYNKARDNGFEQANAPFDEL